MNIFKKLISYALVLSMLIGVLTPCIAGAEEQNIYSISNGYLTYTFHADTGGFAIETAEGNPKKSLDNNIPLLYSEDKARSNGTSFVSVRIDDKDYVFGQDYGFFGLSSTLGTPVVSEEGRLLTVPWTINGVTVKMKVALGTDENTDTLGNAGFSFEVSNASGKTSDISVRLMLDTALGNDTDAPYVVADTDIVPTMTEKKFSGDEVPQQLRCVDSLSNPSKLAYVITKGWSGGIEPSSVIVGHWANLANTRFDYKPDEYCDFTNYSNAYKTPDSAVAVYWEKKAVPNGGSFSAESLYGVGNFTNDDESDIGLNIVCGRVELDESGKAYKNGGEFDVTVEIDNSGDIAVPLTSAQLNLTVDEKFFEIVGGIGSIVTINEIGKEVVTRQFRLRAKPQTDLTAGTVYASLTATANLSDGTQKTVETAGEDSVILRSVSGKTAEVQMSKVSPEIVWTGGEKAITVSGSMKPFKALSGNQGWDLRLKHKTSGHSVLIEKKNIAFMDEEYQNLSFTTKEELEVGEYSLVFTFSDKDLIAEFGKSITAKAALTVSADEKYKLKSYGTIALVRITKNNATDYEFFTFANEGEYKKFYNGEIEKTGEIRSEKLKFDFGKDENAIADAEVILNIRGGIREMKRDSGERYWQAEFGDGDIIINNMLSYEGDKPLEIYEKNGAYTVKGDGLLKVVNSINVWRSKWSFTVNKGVATTLDTERFQDASALEPATLTLSLDGAATMIQMIGGFLIDLKFGEMSSSWYEDGDGVVTYGIGFGGSISLPIKAPKKKDEPQRDLTADQEDISMEMNNLFDDSDPDDYSDTFNQMFDETPQPTSDEKTKISKDTKLSEGELSAEINNILFGERGEVKDGKVEVEDDKGYIGIDAKFSLGLPKDLLGSLVSNAPGIYASVTINTIENVYEINAGLNIKVIECEGVLAFKQVKLKGKDKILPDKIEFYIRDGLRIPLAPPVLFMTGLGGGINDLADSIGGSFDKLPPVTLLLFTRLEAIGVLTGDFNARISLEGLSLTGDMNIKYAKGILNLQAGIQARWIEPWELNLYGSINIIDGLIKGGITVNIADDYFYGYIYASLCIPDSIPFVGGKELAGVEAAASHEFIGANIKIIGIKFGVIYYWGEKVSFGKNIDLSAPSRGGDSLGSADEGTALYGTNIRALSVVSLAAPENAKEAIVKTNGAGDQDALLLEIPYTGAGTPKAGEITVISPKDGIVIETTPDDGNGGGNMVVQNRDDGNFIYVTVTDKNAIANGEWKVKYTTENIEIKTFSMNAVDDIAELTGVSASHDSSESFDMAANLTVTGKAHEKGCVDVYLTEDPDVLDKIKASKNSGDALGINILHKDGADIKSGTENITLPDSFPSGTYYMVATVSATDGISLAIDKTPITFKNPKLPKSVSSVHIAYGGNGGIFVSATDAENADYTHYLAEIISEDGKILDNAYGQFAMGSNFVFGKEANLEVGKNYFVRIKTLRETADPNDESKTLYYYGDGYADSNILTLPNPKTPKLLSVKTNFDTTKEFINQDSVTVEYTFSEPAFVELSVNGLKAYSDNKFKTDWKFVLDNLEDGDYIIDFTAYADNKDHITGADAYDIENSQLGFTVDTSLPVLSLTRNTAASIEDPSAAVAIGANVITADESGAYTIEGMTENSAVLTVDGSSDGINISNNGGFTISKTLPEGKMSVVHRLKAADRAGNETELVVTVIRGGSAAISGIEIQNGGKSVAADSNGIKKISIRNGQSIDLTALLSANGSTYIADEGDVEWNIMYAKNIVSFEGGKLTALIPGETAVKAKISTADVETEDGKIISAGVSDNVVIEVGTNTRDDLEAKIAEAEGVLASEPNASESRKNALSDAIEKAKAVLNNSSSTDKDYTDSVSDLTEAIALFKKGDRPSGGSSSGSGSVRYYKVTVLESEHGKVTVSSERAASGTSVTVTATPDEGFVIADILINGMSVGRTSPYTIKSIDRDIEVKAVFAEKSRLPFTDVIESDWFYDNVAYVYDNNLFKGITDTLFGPNQNLTRAMLVTVLHRAEGEPKASRSSGFEDVLDGAYYKDAVAWAAENGIVSGYSETEFAPDDLITREQIAAIMYRYAGFKGIGVSAGESFDISSYADFADISEYAVPALKWTAASKIMVGRTETTLDPKATATRAEAAAILQRLLER